MTENEARVAVDRYRVCQWCGNDRVDDPDITWAIKLPDKPVGLCGSCALELPDQWTWMVMAGEQDNGENDA